MLFQQRWLAIMIRRPPLGLKIFCCSASAKRAYKGNTSVCRDHISVGFLVILGISCSVLAKIKISACSGCPLPSASAKHSSTACTTARGRFSLQNHQTHHHHYQQYSVQKWTITHFYRKLRPSTSKIGASLKYWLKRFTSKVEVTITFKSGRFGNSCLR